MKFKNAAIKLEQKRVALPNRSDANQLELLFTALPLGFAESFRKLCPRPSPKYTATHGPNGVSRVANYEDPEFHAALAEHSNMQNVFTVYSSLQHDPDLSFDNKCDSVDGVKAVAAEMAASGLSEGDMLFMVAFIMNISAITEDAMKAAKASFT